MTLVFFFHLTFYSQKGQAKGHEKCRKYQCP